MQLSTLIKKALELLFSQIVPKWPASPIKGWQALDQGQKEGAPNVRKED